MTPLLHARQVSAAHDTGPLVLRDADLCVRAGRRLAVLGPNGGGKTTLFRVLAGALRPRAGEVLLDGAPVDYSRRGLADLRRQVQLVLQDPGDQLFAATVWQDVSFGPVNLGLDEGQVRERVAAALAALDVADLADRPTHQLSLGQQKRVSIAGAVAVRPRLLVLDEPSAGLDPAGVDLLLETLAGLERSGTTLLLSTHDVDLAWGWADDVAVVLDGAVTTGPATDVLTDEDLLARARLQTPWAPLAARTLGLPPDAVRRRADLQRLLARD